MLEVDIFRLFKRFHYGNLLVQINKQRRKLLVFVYISCRLNYPYSFTILKYDDIIFSPNLYWGVLAYCCKRTVNKYSYTILTVQRAQITLNVEFESRSETINIFYHFIISTELCVVTVVSFINYIIIYCGNYTLLRKSSSKEVNVFNILFD